MEPFFKTSLCGWIAVALTLKALTCPAAQTPRTNAEAAKLFRDRIDPHWFAANHKFWYNVVDREHGSEFVLVDATNGTRAPAFDHLRLANALSRFTGATVKAGQFPFDRILFSEDEKSVQLLGEKRAWHCDLETYEIMDANAGESEKSTENGPPRPGRRRSRSPSSSNSPDGKWEAFARDHNLFVRNLETKEERALTKDADSKNSYARDAQRDRAIELEYETRDPESEAPQVFWSPDSRKLVAMRTRPGAQRKVYLVESSPKDQVQPKLQSYPYLKPGDEIPIHKPHLFDREAGHEIAINDALFANPWSITELRWSGDSSRFTFLYNQRGHQILRILAVNANNGGVQALVDEESKTFIDYAGKSFSEYLEETDEIIWMSERDGWNHLYLFDAKAGAVKNQITKGEWVVRGVERVDKEKRQIWFRGGGIRPGPDPYYVHYARVNFDGTGLIVLTQGEGTHSAQFSPDQRFLIDTWSRVDLAPVNELRRCNDGKLVCKLEEADVTLLMTNGWRPPTQFAAKGRDGQTDIYGIIHRPKNFDPDKRYPVIESIYAGPHSSFVPKSFRASYAQQKLADRGFVVVQIDGMGTSNRSKKFHDVCWKNLGDAGFPDRILWMKAAAHEYPYIDISRVGIYGGSAGGQSAFRALLPNGDFFKDGPSGCGFPAKRTAKNSVDDT